MALENGLEPLRREDTEGDKDQPVKLLDQIGSDHSVAKCGEILLYMIRTSRNFRKIGLIKKQQRSIG